MAQRKPRTWRWVVNINNASIKVFVGFGRPKFDPVNERWWNTQGTNQHIYTPEFKRIFGFLPPPNRPVKIEFTAKPLYKVKP